MQLSVGWSVATADHRAFTGDAYTTPYELGAFDPEAEGFEKTVVTKSAGVRSIRPMKEANAAEGRRLAEAYACIACHATDNTRGVKPSPSWRGLYGRQHQVFIAGWPATLEPDESYLLESILQPTHKLSAGFGKGEYAMPSYAGILTDRDIESLILYLKTLQQGLRWTPLPPNPSRHCSLNDWSRPRRG